MSILGLKGLLGWRIGVVGIEKEELTVDSGEGAISVHGV